MSRIPQTDSGLYVLTQGQDEAAVQRALREHDPDLRLIPQDSDHYGQRVYKVYRYAGPERPAEFLFHWGDDYGNAWPLSMQIVERAKQFDKNMRGHEEYVDPDTHNKLLKEERDKDYDKDVETIQEENLKRKGRLYTFHRSQALRMARDRQRRKGYNV